jgi:ferredoxin
MSSTAVLLCSGTELAADVLDHAPIIVVSDLCGRPGEAASVIRSLAATRVVLALCERGPSAELVNTLRRAGVSPFGIESVTVGGRGLAETALLIRAAVSRLDALAPGDNGKSVFATAGLSRRALLQLAPVVTHAPVAVIDEPACAGAARCGLCAAACPETAIGLDGALPVVDAAACTACGTCVPRCPFGALRLAGSSTAQIEAQLEQLLPHVAGVVLACSAATVDSPPGWAVVELPTLGLFSPGWLLQLWARGVQVQLGPCQDACCSDALAAEAFATRVLAAIGEHRNDEARVHLGEPTSRSSRRGVRA